MSPHGITVDSWTKVHEIRGISFDLPDANVAKFRRVQTKSVRYPLWKNFPQEK